MRKFFVVNFDGGFDITNSLSRVEMVVSKFNGIEIHEANDLWLAYQQACIRYTAKKLSSNTFFMPTLPKFEDVVKAPFYERIIPITGSRFFALITDNYCASISTEILDIVNFLHYFNHCIVKEFSGYEEALNFINRIFLTPIISMGAYLKQDIPLIDELDNKVSQLPYSSWLDQNCELPPEKRFTPENCVKTPEEEEFTLPLDLVELPPQNQAYPS